MAFVLGRVYTAACLKGRAVINVLNKSRPHYPAYGWRLKSFLVSFTADPLHPRRHRQAAGGFNGALFVDSFIRKPVLWT